MAGFSLSLEHALVTDAGRTEGGYGLVAASEGVHREDARFLDRYPGVSDYLHHSEDSPVHLSFYPLPSGNRAFTRRFAAGRRRGDYHRIVIHTVVLDEASLAWLGYEPALLLAKCNMGLADEGDPDGTMSTVGSALADVVADGPLPALACRLQESPAQGRQDMMSERVRFLSSAWGRVPLARRLGWILDCMQSRYRVLLPQGLEHETLLMLAWSSLPVSDKLASPWTSHFAPGVKVAFRLANTPDFEATIRMHAKREEWVVLDSDDLNGEADRPALWLASEIIDSPPAEREVLLNDMQSHELSLLTEPDAFSRWTVWRRELGNFRKSGFPSAAELEQFLTAIAARSRPDSYDPWLAHTMLITGTCRTTLNMAVNGAPLETAIKEVGASIKRSGMSGFFFRSVNPRSLFETLGASGDEVGLVAVGLYAGGLAESNEAGATTLAEWLDDGARIGRLASSQVAQATAHVSAALFRLLCRSGSVSGPRLLASTLSQPGLVDTFISGLDQEDAELSELTLLIQGLQPHRSDLAAALFRRRLVTLVATRDDEVDAFGDRIREALALAEHEPEALVWAIRNWRGVPRQWALEAMADLLSGESPTAGLQVAATVAPIAPRLVGVDDRSLARVARRVCELASDQAWMPWFLLADAMRLDHAGSPDGRRDFAEYCGKTALGRSQQLCLATPLLSAVQEATVQRGETACLAALSRTCVSALVERLHETIPSMATLLGQPGVSALEWEDTILDVACSLDSTSRTDATRLRGLWWGYLFGSTPLEIPRRSARLFQDLSDRELGDVLRILEPHIPAVENDEQSLAVLKLARRLARRADVAATFEASWIRREFSHGRLSREKAFNAIDRLASGQPDQDSLWSNALRWLLPPHATSRIHTLINCIAARNVSPTVKRYLERKVLADELAMTELWLWPRGLDLARMARRGNLLLAFASNAGRRWRDHPPRATEVFSELAKLGRVEALEAFLLKAKRNSLFGKDFLEHLADEGRNDILNRLHRLFGNRTSGSTAELARRLERALDRMAW